MKKILFLLSLIALTLVAATNTEAQSTTPRYGITTNSNNTGSGLTYKYATYTDVAGVDTFTVRPNAYQSNYKITLTDSLVMRSPVVTNCKYGDKMTIYATGASGKILKFQTGGNWQTTTQAVTSSGLTIIIEYFFNGAIWCEVYRKVL